MSLSFIHCILIQKVRLLGAILSLILVSGLPTWSNAAEKLPSLVILNWSDYLDPELIQAFEKQHEATIKFVYFDTEEDRDKILVESQGAGFDLVLVSGANISKLIKNGWVHRLNKAPFPNYQHLDPEIVNMRPELKEYAIPYFWGTLGIAYRKDLITTPITTWKDLFQPQEAWKGKVYMIKDALDTMSMAFKALGYSVEHYGDASALAEVEQLLLEQKPYVKDYSYIGADADSMIVKGDIWMAMVYNGDALGLQEHQPEITYVAPTEGTHLWIDYWLVMKQSTNQALALQFLNFINEPQNAAKNAQTYYFATGNRTAKDFLPPDHLNDPIIYPSETILSNSHLVEKLAPRTARKWNAIFSKLKP